MPTIYQIIITSLLSAFVILFLTITGLRYKMRDWCDMYEAPLIAKMLNCDFCFSFWASFAISCIIAGFSNELSYLFIPFLSTPITRLLL